MAVHERVQKTKTTYEVRFQYKDKYGVSQIYQKRGFKTKKEAKNHELYIREQIRQGNDNSAEKSLNEVFEEQMRNDMSIADSTKQIRKQYYNKHVAPRIGKAQIKLLDYAIIQNMFNELADTHSKATNDNILKLLNSVFKYAFNYGYINKLPYAKIVVKGKKTVKKDKIISEADFEDLIQYTETCKMSKSLRFKSYRVALYIGHYTGMRLGEVCALDKSDIDFEHKLINVSKSIYVDLETKELMIKDTKTETSTASIPLPLPLEQILLEWFEENKTDHVLIDNDLGYIKPGLIKGFLENFSNKSKHKVHFHMLRHTYTTMLFENNIDAKTAQTLLRHKDYNTTMSVYTHLEKEKLNTVVDNIFKS